jgi:hypothetical protein
MDRRGRLTLRCLQEDLGLAIPGLNVDLGLLDHHWLRELVRVTPDSPVGQKRIESIETPLVYRLRIANERGATWVEDAKEIVWLCAVKPRRDGSDEDAYVQIPRLHSRGDLLPNQDDGLRDDAENVTRYFKVLSDHLRVVLLEAQLKSGVEIRRNLDDWLPCRMLVMSDSDAVEEIWCALGIVVTDGRKNKPELRELLFANLAQFLPDAEFEIRSDWPSGPVEWFECVRLGLRETD